jgi:hypothetical protein
MNDNIVFFVNEANDINNIDNEDKIQKMLDEFTGLSDFDISNNINSSNNYDMDYGLFGIDDCIDNVCYELMKTKDLLKIASYYGLDKDIKMSKLKKKDLISMIVYFESFPENIVMIKKRNRMWSHIKELLNDPKMKKYVFWD